MRKVLGIFIVCAFLFIGAFGMNLSMATNENGTMSDCPWMNNSTSFCQMGVMDHIQKWQQALQAIIPQINSFLMILLFVSSGFFLFFKIYSGLSPPKIVSLKYYQKAHPESNLFNYLLLAFSDGILQPKIYG